jgi:hypothetical protein
MEPYFGRSGRSVTPGKMVPPPRPNDEECAAALAKVELSPAPSVTEHQLTCERPGCGRLFTARRPGARTCSGACRVRLHRAERSPKLTASTRTSLPGWLESGLTVCNYTGDLKTTSEAALKDFRDLTGRDQPYDSEVIDRGTLHVHGCDILLTNFKMLEYALVRREDARLFHGLDFGGRLQFLVLGRVSQRSAADGSIIGE